MFLVLFVFVYVHWKLQYRERHNASMTRKR